MSTPEDFLKSLREDTELAKELENYIGQKAPADETAKLEALTAFAREKGWEIEEEDLALAQAEVRELSDDALAGISGGTDQRYEICWFDYLCSWTWNTCRASNECEGGHFDCKTSVSAFDCITGMDQTDCYVSESRKCFEETKY